jgi:hypothetical protein
MTDEDKIAMEQFGITYEQKTIFTFQGHKYERLADALKYAEIFTDNAKPLVSDAKG